MRSRILGFSSCNEIVVTSRYMRSGSGALSTRGTKYNAVKMKQLFSLAFILDAQIAMTTKEH